MLKSNNFNSIADDLSALNCQANLEVLRPATIPIDTNSNISAITLPSAAEAQTIHDNNKFHSSNAVAETILKVSEPEETSIAAAQLTVAVLQSYASPIAKAKGQLKELIQKQNKVYIDLSAEKFKLDNAEISKLHDMMNNVKIYREKLLKLKRNMQNIYQRTKVLKKRAINIQTCKEKELQRKIQKQQQEESLIGKQS